MSKTFAILKPDLMSCPPLAVEAIQRIIASKLKINRTALVERVDKAKLKELYAEHAGRFYHNRLIRTVGSGPVLLMELEAKESSSKVDPISEWRSMIGPSKYLKGFPTPDNHETFRWNYALSDVRNAAHGADSAESATRELRLFEDQFEPFDIDKLMRKLCLQPVEGDGE
ncbi:unnamed protein product [Bursaphelenchus okinawaensis]|uniref:Nucleoside diphosphate kinase-like domain-containing protein n=1 Tax=Bursaphelenchus okinawaensis TaxID=465554 RepID=A0A811LRW9_9BILA|nr:unnamed protein product [Bursaphelenchus okinawaensis]CAG9127854.1 unnamed protein product [Bursaphelenchus okinawaensis]